MHTEKIRNLNFQAKLECSAGIELLVSCKISLSYGGWDASLIEIELPHHMDIMQIRSPSTIIGTDAYGRRFELKGVYHSSIPFNPGRTAGGAQMKIEHIEKLIVSYRVNNISSRSSLDLLLSPHHTLVNWLHDESDSDEFEKVEDLFELDLPIVGTARFRRVWSFYVSGDRLEAKAVCSFRATVLHEGALPSPDTSGADIRAALVIASIFSRQRIGVVGWTRVDKSGSREDVFHQPLAPLRTHSASFSANVPMLEAESFSKIVNSACAAYSAMSPDYQNLIEIISMGLVPYVKQSTSERFISMFNALEQCRTFAIKKPTAEMLVKDDELIKALETAKLTVSEDIKDRIQGFIRRVEKPTVDLKIQIEEILSEWGVVRNDLWPFSASEKSPGLKQIRDRLSHTGSAGVNGHSLTVACLHLSVLLERIVLRLLDVQLTETDVSLKTLQTDEWFSRTFVLAERKAILDNPDW